MLVLLSLVITHSRLLLCTRSVYFASPLPPMPKQQNKRKWFCIQFSTFCALGGILEILLPKMFIFDSPCDPWFTFLLGVALYATLTTARMRKNTIVNINETGRFFFFSLTNQIPSSRFRWKYGSKIIGTNASDKQKKKQWLNRINIIRYGNTVSA